mgnify:CR=1 FL=1
MNKDKNHDYKFVNSNSNELRSLILDIKLDYPNHFIQALQNLGIDDEITMNQFFVSFKDSDSLKQIDHFDEEESNMTRLVDYLISEAARSLSPNVLELLVEKYGGDISLGKGTNNSLFYLAVNSYIDRVISATSKETIIGTIYNKEYLNSDTYYLLSYLVTPSSSVWSKQVELRKIKHIDIGDLD